MTLLATTGEYLTVSEQLVLPRQCHCTKSGTQYSHSWPSGRAETNSTKVLLAGSTLRCGGLLQELHGMPEAVQEEGLQVTTSSTPSDFQTVQAHCGTLPRNSCGNWYVLVVCDYATQYPEGLLCRAWVAEELVLLFTRKS